MSRGHPDWASPTVLCIALWVWLIAVLAGYLYQFRGLVTPLLKLMG